MSSKRIKFSISSIILKFSRLSECLDILSILANCHEIRIINIIYCEVDLDNEEETIKAAMNFISKKFGVIEQFTIKRIS